MFGSIRLLLFNGAGIVVTPPPATCIARTVGQSLELSLGTPSSAIAATRPVSLSLSLTESESSCRVSTLGPNIALGMGAAIAQAVASALGPELKLDFSASQASAIASTLGGTIEWPQDENPATAVASTIPPALFFGSVLIPDAPVCTAAAETLFEEFIYDSFTISDLLASAVIWALFDEYTVQTGPGHPCMLHTHVNWEPCRSWRGPAYPVPDGSSCGCQVRWSISNAEEAQRPCNRPRSWVLETQETN